MFVSNISTRLQLTSKTEWLPASSVDSIDTKDRKTPSPPPAAGAEYQVLTPPADGQGVPNCTSSPTTTVATKVVDDGQKPALSYIALISMAILSHPEKKLLLGDIYQYIMDKYSYYKITDDRAWRNSIRHNLSLNECFIKNGRADNGKGNFWSIHPACEDDFAKGDYRRRQARRRARRSTPTSMNQIPHQYRYSGYIPMQPIITNFGMSSYNGYGRHMPYSYGSYGAFTGQSPVYGSYLTSSSPNTTLNTPTGSASIHHQQLGVSSTSPVISSSPTSPLCPSQPPSPVSSLSLSHSDSGLGSSLSCSPCSGSSLAGSPTAGITGITALGNSPPSGFMGLQTSGFTPSNGSSYQVQQATNFTPCTPSANGSNQQPSQYSPTHFLQTGFNPISSSMFNQASSSPLQTGQYSPLSQLNSRDITFRAVRDLSALTG